MIEAALSQMSMHHAELALRMVVGILLGGLIGWERSVEDRYFGLRIHMLTSLAAAGFSVAALEAVAWAEVQNIEVDPFRILQAVVSGLALLAAGTIIKGDGQVKGLTTGVGLWLAGAIGVAAGAGLYAVSVFIATLSFAILYGLRQRPQRRPSDGTNAPKSTEKCPIRDVGGRLVLSSLGGQRKRSPP